MPPRNPEPSEAIDADDLEHEQQRDGAKRQIEHAGDAQARHGPTTSSAATRSPISPTTRPPAMVRSVGRSRSRANIALAERDAAHQNNAEHRRQQARASRRAPDRAPTIVVFSGATTPSSAGDKLLRHQKADQRRNADRRQAGRRIAADDQLEAVERAGERRAERAGNAGGGAATDQDAQVAAAQPERIADARGDAAGESAYSRPRGRPRRRRRSTTSSARRRSCCRCSDMRPPCSALASIGSISRSGRQRAIISLDTPKSKPPSSGTDNASIGLSVSRADSRSPCCRLKNNLVEQIDGVAHGGDDQPADHADQRRKQDQARFPRPHEGAQPPRYFELRSRLEQSRCVTAAMTYGTIDENGRGAV